MAKKSVLGKGLAALIGDDYINNKSEEIFLQEQSGKNRENAFILLNVNEIIPNDEQPRKIFDESTITELAQSIKEKGVLQPIIVTKKNNKYMLVIGERRWRATKKAGLEQIPAFVKDYSDTDVLELALIENIQREDLNPIEEAAAFSHLIDRLNITQEKLSERIGKSRTAITNKMRLLKLPENIREDIVFGKMSEGHGKAILYLDGSDEKMILLHEKVISENLSVRETESLAKSWINLDIKEINNTAQKTDKSKIEKPKSPNIQDMEEKFSTIFGTRVTINDNNNKGKIIIDYYSLEDFERILEKVDKKD